MKINGKYPKACKNFPITIHDFQYKYLGRKNTIIRNVNIAQNFNKNIILQHFIEISLIISVFVLF